MANALAPQQPTLRAFVVYNQLPAGCVAHLITDQRSEPLLRPGDVVVVDTTDREPAEHALFAIDFGKSSGRPHRVVIQMRTRQHRNGEGAFIGWWCDPYNRPGSGDDLTRKLEAGAPIYFSDGPYDAARSDSMTYLRNMLVGRIVGILEPRFAEPRRLAAPPHQGEA